MIGKKLATWARERRISEQTSDRNGFCANIMEEMYEYQKGIDSGNEHEVVDSLADMIVFSEVEMLKFGLNPDEVTSSKTDYSDFKSDMIIAIGKWLDETVPEKVEAMADIVAICKHELEDGGYNPEKVLNETFKEIDSRTGEWNDEAKKWLKYKTPEAMALWYKADYSDCKL
jgi:hypothetical protein